MTRPPVADPDTAALIAKLRKAAQAMRGDRASIGYYSGLIDTAADELTRLSALSVAAHEATHALVAQAAETERRYRQIEELQAGLRDALATIARLRGIIDAGESETVTSLRDALRWMVNLVHGVGKAGGSVEDGEWDAAAENAVALLPADAALAKDGAP